MKKFDGVLFTVVVLLAFSSSVTAVPITRTFFFEASGFEPTAPTDPVIGSFTATFEPGVPMSSPMGAVSASLSIAGVSFDADNVIFQYLGGPIDDIQFGGVPSGLGLEPGTVDFFFEIEMASGEGPSAPAGTGFQYGDTDLVSYASAETVVALVPPTSAPEPATLVLLGLGLTGLGYQRRKHLKGGEVSSLERPSRTPLRMGILFLLLGAGESAA